VTTTYTNTLLTFRDRARFRLGDTDTTNALLSDEEIAAALTINVTEDPAVAWLAQGLIARYSREPVKFSADGVMFDFSERVKVWREIVARASDAATSGARIRRLGRPRLINGGTET
jgi:hypothetical protein